MFAIYHMPCLPYVANMHPPMVTMKTPTTFGIPRAKPPPPPRFEHAPVYDNCSIKQCFKLYKI